MTSLSKRTAGLTVLTVLMVSLISGCSKQVQIHDSKPNIREYCYQGIAYFAVNNGHNITPYLTGAVIDPETLQPKRCNF